jgi:hypothetical protein
METSMSDETIDLFVQHAIERANENDDNFWKEVEAQAARFEVTVDYYLAEFC